VAPDWYQIGNTLVRTRLASDWDQIGTRLVPGWYQTDWYQIGTVPDRHQIGTRLVPGWYRTGTRVITLQYVCDAMVTPLPAAPHHPDSQDGSVTGHTKSSWLILHPAPFTICAGGHRSCDKFAHMLVRSEGGLLEAFAFRALCRKWWVAVVCQVLPI
jgi:hypothetical protein